MQCPRCNSADTGKVGTNQYYCWQCLMEFKVNPHHAARMFYVEADGTLSPVSLKQGRIK